MDYDEEEYAFGADSTPAGLGPFGSTPKIPPTYDGRASWFAYEEAIDDWTDITTLAPEKLGPSLKNRFTGDASV